MRPAGRSLPISVLEYPLSNNNSSQRTNILDRKETTIHAQDVDQRTSTRPNSTSAVFRNVRFLRQGKAVYFKQTNAEPKI